MMSQGVPGILLDYPVNEVKKQPREIHIWEFPPEFYIQLEPNIIEELLNRAIEAAGGNNPLARAINKHVSALYTYRTGERFIPLSILMQLCDFTGTAIEQMERHIVAYKRSGHSYPIQNLILPIRETPKLFALMGHLIGDGGYRKSNAYYWNNNKVVIHEFLSLLQSVFGDVRTTVQFRKNCFAISFGITIIHLLRHIYNIDFRTFTARVPIRLFDLPREYAAAFLRAYADDEGSVEDDLRVSLTSANEELIQDIYTLVQAKFPELSEFVIIQRHKTGKRSILKLRFKAAACADYMEFIGFTHPEKRYRLESILTHRTRGWWRRDNGETRLMILKALNSRALTTDVLVQKFEISAAAIRWHLKDFILLEFVRVEEKKKSNRKRGKLFEITIRGRKFLQSSVKDLFRFGRGKKTKLALLRVLARSEDGLVVAELARQAELQRRVADSHLHGRCRNRTTNPGLVTLDLVECSGEGVRADPRIYHLTNKGQQLIKELETHFPELYDLA